MFWVRGGLRDLEQSKVGESTAWETGYNAGVGSYPLTEERVRYMKAIVSIKGNQVEGYTVRVFLPKEWLNRFSSRLGCQIYYTSACPSWGYPANEEGYRSQFATCDTLEEGRRVAEERKCEIEAAKKKLAEVTNTEIIHEIDL